MNTLTFRVPLSSTISAIEHATVNKGIRITTSHPVSVVSVLEGTHLDMGVLSARLVLPKIPLVAEEYEYLVLTNKGTFFYFVLTGMENDTTVRITAQFPLWFQHENDMNPEALPVKVTPGDAYFLTIDALQVFRYSLKGGDGTGIRIVSNKPLAITSGNNYNQFENGPPPIWCPMLVQIPPVAVWGRTFLLGPFVQRSQGQFYNMVSSQVGTTAWASCTNGMYQKWSFWAPDQSIRFITTANQYCSLHSTKPLMVSQSTHFSHSIGSALLVVPPIEHYSSSFVFRTPSDYAQDQDDKKHYISILVTKDINKSQLLYNDVPLPASVSWTTIKEKDGSTAGYGCWFRIEEGRHTLELKSGKRGVSAILFGYQRTKSTYAYPLGMTFGSGKLRCRQQCNYLTFCILH